MRAGGFDHGNRFAGGLKVGAIAQPDGTELGPFHVQLTWPCADGHVSVTFLFGVAIALLRAAGAHRPGHHNDRGPSTWIASPFGGSGKGSTASGPRSLRTLRGLAADAARNGADARPTHRDPDESALFHNLNANELGMTLELSNPTTQDIILDLVRWSDVIVESFAKGREPMGSWRKP